MKEDLLKKLMSNENDENEMSEMQRYAREDILKELIKLLSDSAGEGIKEGMQQLTVTAPDQESMMEGIKKAKEIVESSPEMLDELKKKRKA